MGRPRKILDLQTKHLTNQEKLKKGMEEKAIKAPDNELEKPPTWLRDSIAKKEWKRLIKNFKIIGTINNLDLNNLGCYCNAYSNYREATKEMKKHPLIEYTNTNDSVCIVENPFIKVQLKYSEEIKKYSALLGLTIDARLKMGQIKVNEEQKEISDKFGNI
ncbi:terminase [Clostridium sp. DMHC 10]|uniref:phage terminase small subunit P27 family n=1 Tax=Clostridium sp. DMHC 10 TaxID=747377 RepID=UPI00069D2917|nr:phage terminase small subunit P27 family [Clostridium sp. DMHC 10]KOF56805.1 terminase [Clostridium sp. DMHC 10]